jgi:hypothetical protein
MASNHFDSNPSDFALQTNNHQRTWSTSEPYASVITKVPVAFPLLSDYSVVCGRGKASYNHVGNHRFRILASMCIERYALADSKLAKSAIVSEIIDVIRQAGGHFCKFQRGVWFEIAGHQAREKVSSLLRDLLHSHYRSSAKAKVGRRFSTKTNQNQNEQSGQKRVDGGDDSDDSSTTSSCWGRTKESLGFEYWLEEPDDFFDIDVF